MAEKKIVRKVISSPKKNLPDEKVAPSEKVSKPEETPRTKKPCFFCQSKAEPDYTDTNTLRRFTTDRAKILPRTKNNLCAKHQRSVTRNIKYARHLSLLPFV